MDLYGHLLPKWLSVQGASVYRPLRSYVLAKTSNTSFSSLDKNSARYLGLDPTHDGTGLVSRPMVQRSEKWTILGRQSLTETGPSAAKTSATQAKYVTTDLIACYCSGLAWC